MRSALIAILTILAVVLVGNVRYLAGVVGIRAEPLSVGVGLVLTLVVGGVGLWLLRREALKLRSTGS